ncbi:TrbI/VirB10 family protein [Erythrobacter sp. HL-111]|uniref:TrbI/VirB10 family protein n=1 Tax=Erythrobacter sp. HL-111 TaxID=1798193 RepID=UPI0006DB0FD6|nr:TrbI/VirB10 family protein [Erythrobacter sp. HL-111]KPP93935.1 MAG: type IV secretion system protein VirB10 [Erythrobacteraceae bacterium HL-111]SDS32731.1 type IV secretion system protein VirB10 [Erythrobacter sp. HL-111]
MRLAMRLPPKKGDTATGADGDPREQESAEVIDLASRSAFPGVADRKAKTDGLGLAAGGLIVLALGATTFWAMNAPETPEPEPIGNPAVAPPQAAAPDPAPAPAETPAPQEERPDPAPAPILANDPGAETAGAANPYASPTMVYDASTAASAMRLAEPAADAAAAGEAMPGGEEAMAGGSAAAFASRIGGVGGMPAQARAMVNPTTTVTQGTMIPAVLETAINTDVPGYVRAVVSQDVRSFDGKKVLIPRSSRLIGQYQSGVQQGQKRAYVIWTRLIRPDGASINIASPAVAFDGTTGLAGDVDSHFFKRFGSAMLLSVVGGLGALATGGVGGVIVAGGAQNAANSAVQADGQISPTIRVRMGEPIRVFTARDLDFSTVSN